MTPRQGTIGLHPLWLLLAGLVLLPAIEFSAFFWVAGKVGVLIALLLLVATSFLGVALMRRQGGAAMSRLMAAFRRGEPPQGAARESFMVALGGLLMILPGFVSDAIGFALIFPSLLRTLREGRAPIPAQQRQPRADPSGRVIDLDREEWKSIENRRS
jgi:UPF0716 protein FxsA